MDLVAIETLRFVVAAHIITSILIMFGGGTLSIFATKNGVSGGLSMLVISIFLSVFVLVTTVFGVLLSFIYGSLSAYFYVDVAMIAVLMMLCKY